MPAIYLSLRIFFFYPLRFQNTNKIQVNWEVRNLFQTWGGEKYCNAFKKDSFFSLTLLTVNWLIQKRHYINNLKNLYEWSEILKQDDCKITLGIEQKVLTSLTQMTERKMVHSFIWKCFLLKNPNVLQKVYILILR